MSDLQPHYCTPDDVADTMDLPDPNDSMGTFSFSDMSHPSYDQVCRMILSNEDIIDRRLGRSWRENRVKDQVLTINNYQHDENGLRGRMYAEGGNYLRLHKDICPWDPTKGDRLEVRTLLNEWKDITLDIFGDNDERYSYNLWFDYPYGKLYIRPRFFQRRYNAIRISYRWGSEEPVPPAISRLCAIRTAAQIINASPYLIKVGAGGDISGAKDAMVQAWAEEEGQIFSSFQRSGTVYSLYR